jgi:hypothetical protein
MRTPSFIALLVIAATAGACTVASAQVDVTDLCVPYDGVNIAGVASGTTFVDHDWTFTKLGVLPELVQSVSDLQFVRIEAQATSGVSDLGFVQAAHVTVGSGNPDAMLPTVDAYDCSGNCVPDGSTLDVPSMLQTSAIAYIESGSVQVDLEVDGTLPVQAWTMDVQLCFRGDVGYSQPL